MITSEKNLTFHDINEFRFSVKKGSGIETIEELSDSRNEPDWLQEFRLRSYDFFVNKSVSNSICDPIEMDLRNINHHNTTSGIMKFYFSINQFMIHGILFTNYI